ncbi:HU family DNA-binding protein [Marichromatium purpuratum]|uniref:HU family DNA-binding protein n=1 Tax=Marichromatium purpuratum TaxID=37487 RepID=UPI0018DE4B1A|nr:HU family DNA-binding protein [Marichromatium purpuratum]
MDSDLACVNLEEGLRTGASGPAFDVWHPPHRRRAVSVYQTRQVTGGSMNKSDLIEAMADAADISKAAAARALDAFTDSVAVTLKDGGTVSLIGFGTFSVKERAARTGRNPQTGATIEIKASKTPAFKAGKALKDAVQ